MLCNVVHGVLSSYKIISTRKRDVAHGYNIIIVSLLASGNECSVTPTHNVMGWSVIVAFSSHTQLLYYPVAHRNLMDHAVDRMTKQL